MSLYCFFPPKHFLSLDAVLLRCDGNTEFRQDLVVKGQFKYYALLPPCIDQSCASRRGELSNTVPGAGGRAVGVGSIVSGLANPPHALSPFLRDLHQTIRRTVETPHKSLPHELSTARASPRVCSWVRIGATPPGPFLARARVEVGDYP